jgi:hypothetical protein
MQHDLEKALNMKLILWIFWTIIGIKLNFHRSEVFCFGKVKEVQEQYQILFNCESGSFLLDIWEFLSISAS